MLGYADINGECMDLTQEEWNEMDSLRRAIHDNPSSVHPEKMERFTELFVRTLPTAEVHVPV